MSQVNIILSHRVTEFGCRNAGRGNGTQFELPVNRHMPVSEYRQESDGFGVRFIWEGVLFRNFDHPHTTLQVTTRPITRAEAAAHA